MHKVTLKNKTEVTIRKAIKEDARPVVAYLNHIGGESDFLSFGKNEFALSVEDEEKYIENLDKSYNSAMFIAIIENNIVGIVSISSNNKSRTKHVGTLGISLLQKYWGIGLGSELMSFIINWSKSNKITKKISLLVNDDNTRGKALYKKYGFVEEGFLKNDVYLNGSYHDTIIMGLIL